MTRPYGRVRALLCFKPPKLTICCTHNTCVFSASVRAQPLSSNGPPTSIQPPRRPTIARGPALSPSEHLLLLHGELPPAQARDVVGEAVHATRKGGQVTHVGRCKVVEKHAPLGLPHLP